MLSKKTVARSGKRQIESVLFSVRKRLTERYLDPTRDPVLLSWATYSPWLLDDEFAECHQTIRENTLVDRYRCYELWHLLRQTRELAGDILEVGTWRGGTGCLLGHRASLLDLPARVYLCDTFEGVVKTSAADSMYRGGEHSDTSIAIVEECAARFGLTNLTILKGIFPEETGSAIADRSFRFCHIDVDAYQSGKDVLSWVWPRLLVGGIVVFDDFGFSSTRGIAALVHEEEAKPDRVCVQNLNGHAVFVKVS